MGGNYTAKRDRHEEYLSNREHYLAWSKAYHHSPQGRAVVKAWWQKIKVKALTHYGNGKLACVKCGFTDIRALSIDHIDGGGNQHTDTIKRKGSKIYRWLIKNAFPEGYQTLCMNCQFIKRVTCSETRKALEENNGD